MVSGSELVHIVDDEPDVRLSLEAILQSGGFRAQTYGTAQAFLEQADLAQPGCVLVDLLLPGITGLQLCQTLVEAKSNCSFIIISGHGDVSSAVEAMKLGAIDILEKPVSHLKLMSSIQHALRVARLREHETAEEEDVALRISKLSMRETEIFENISAGMVTKEIASRLGISPKTVDVHRSKLSQKLRIDSPTQLAHIISLLRRHNERLRKT